MGGNSDYKIVISESASDTVQTAATEFQYLFKEATGVELPVITDEGLTHSDESCYISLGDTALLSSMGYYIDKDQLTKDGLYIGTKGRTLYLVGGSDNGVLYSVYEYMAQTFAFDTFSMDCFMIDTVDTSVEAVALGDFNLYDIPDIEMRHATNGILYVATTNENADYDAQNYANRMRFVDTNKQMLMPVKNVVTEYGTLTNESGDTVIETIHNTSTYLPYAWYGESHSDWYATRSGNYPTATQDLCYTAHGNATEFAAMTQACADVITSMLTMYSASSSRYSNYKAITLTMEDGAELCCCDTCLAYKEKYGTDAGAIVIFINEVNKLVRAWEALEENAAYARGTDFKILFFAYNTAVKAPVSYDETTGVYSPIDDAVVLDEGVGVYVCAIRGAYGEQITSYFNNINDDENAALRAVIEGWSVLADELYCWTYNSNFKHFLYFHNAFDFYYNGGFSYLADHNVKSLYVQGDTPQYNATTGWNTLQAYLNSKLEWDTDLNVNDLIDKYMSAMYLEAAPTMKALLTDMRAYTETMYAENGLCQAGVDYRAVNKAAYWDYDTLQSWAAMCDTALSQIAKYETSDPELYAKLKNRIEAEWLSPAYMMLDLYADSMTETELSELLTRFETVVNTIGIEKTNEYGGTLADFIAALKTE